MKNKTYLPILLVLIFTCLILFSKKFRMYVTQPLRVENLDAVALSKYNEIKLLMPEEIQQKFDMIYNEYTEDRTGNQYNVFLENLNENNKWEKAKLISQNKTYDVSIKLHGKSPTQHVEGSHYSLGVKVLNNQKINGVSRFNLIVYWRIRNKSDIINYLANTMGLFHIDNELVTVKINEKRKKLYYFEYRKNREYFTLKNKSNLILLKFKSDHSLIYTGGNIKMWEKKLQKAIKKIDIEDSLKTKIYKKYLQLNRAIFEGDLVKVLSHFDLDYLAKIQAFRYLFLDNGHGFGFENLLIAIDTSNLKFYPFVHRDNSPYEANSIPDIDGQFNGSDLIFDSLPLLNIISKSKTLSIKTKEYLTQFLNSGKIDTERIRSIVQMHNSYYYSSSLKQLIGVKSNHSTTISIEKLKKMLIISNN